MSDIVIKAENLGKKYVIGHQTQRGGYTALRDVITQNVRTLWSKTKDLATGKPVIQGDTIEEVWALRDVNFEVHRGEALGIIGRNGAGKSTLLKILSRITEPSTGRVTISGRVASLLEVGTGFHPELTGRENIYLNGTILGMTRVEIKKKFDEIVAFSEVEQYLDTPVKRYSSGMYVRLAFAVAAHLEPEILVVDEVLAVGDASFQQKCLGKMDHVTKEGRTVIFVSHNMTAIQSLCERSILIKNGIILVDGSSSEVINRYLSASGSAVSHVSPGVYNLSNRKNPCMPGNLIIKKLYLMDKHCNKSDIFSMGQGMRVAIDIQGMAVHHDALVGVIFKSDSDQWITSINSGMTCSHIDEPRGKNEKAVLYIPKIPLLPGAYWIDLSIAQRGIGRLDFVERAARFTITEADVYGTGYQLTGYFGLVYLNATWEIRKRNDYVHENGKT